MWQLVKIKKKTNKNNKYQVYYISGEDFYYTYMHGC